MNKTLPRTLLASTLFLLGAVAALAQPCSPSSTALCLSAGRFEVKVAWTDFQGNNGEGQAIPLTADTGYFWFFTNTNVELVIKVLDATGVNGHFWVFYGALSNVEYEITVRDSQTGDLQVYDNPAGQFASVGDTLAFPPSATVSRLSTESHSVARLSRPVGPPVDESRLTPAAWSTAAACTPTPTALCLSGGRFRVEAAWTDFQGNHGAGQAVALTSDTGYFWFFSNTNVEAVIKVLDARPINNYFWVFYGALSNVQYTLTVTDTVTGIVKTYDNPLNLFASVGDTLAFGTPTTVQLIDGGVVKGEIDAETALIYKVYAFFGDPRLPQAYVGAPPATPDHGILSEVANRWSDLSSQTQQTLRPFLTVPTDPGSWFAQIPAFRTPVLERTGSVQDDWTRIPTTHCVVWYRAGDAGAETAANNLAAEAETVWNAETGLMRKPVGDGLLPVPNGGDDRYDIYVLPRIQDPKGADGALTPYPGQDATAPRAAYTLIQASSAATPEAARALLAHEFFHAIAAAYPNGLNGWLNEATATWMEDYVYPTTILNAEQQWAGRYVTDGYKRSYDNPNPADVGYPNYLFLFYLAGPQRASAEVNHKIWVNVGGGAPPAQAIAAATNLEDQWPKFALDCWNHPDVDDFTKWDKMGSALVEGSADPYLGLNSDGGSFDLPSRSVEHLAMGYAYIDVVKDSIKRIQIQNPQISSGAVGGKVQAWIKLADGTTRTEDDWISKDQIVFCRDKASENVTQILILYTNSGLDAPLVWGTGKVKYDSIGCGGYDGTVHETNHQPSGLNETIDVTASFRKVQPTNQGTIIQYYPAQFTIRYYLTGQLGSCTVTLGPITRSFAPDVGTSQSLLTVDTSVNPAGYYAEADNALQGTQTMVCPDGTTTLPTAAAFQWLYIPQGRFTAKSDGSLIDTYSDGTRTWSWNFQPNPDE